jgi:hypothetical protein
MAPQNGHVDFPIEVHDDGAKELEAGLRPLDHYKQVDPVKLYP